MKFNQFVKKKKSNFLFIAKKKGWWTFFKLFSLSFNSCPHNISIYDFPFQKKKRKEIMYMHKKYSRECWVYVSCKWYHSSNKNNLHTNPRWFAVQPNGNKKKVIASPDDNDDDKEEESC